MQFLNIKSEKFFTLPQAAGNSMFSFSFSTDSV